MRRSTDYSRIFYQAQSDGGQSNSPIFLLA